MSDTMTFDVSKRDLFHMSSQQATAGRAMWERTKQKGRLCNSSFEAEDMAPKTWIVWRDGPDLPGGRGKPMIECELYVAGRYSNSREGVGMLIGQCPLCTQYFTVREDNKQMAVEYVLFRKAPRHIKVNWADYCNYKLGKPVMDNDRVPVISSSEPWACDYCRSWCVRVEDGIACNDYSRPRMVIQAQVPLIDKGGGKTIL